MIDAPPRAVALRLSRHLAGREPGGGRRGHADAAREHDRTRPGDADRLHGARPISRPRVRAELPHAPAAHRPPRRGPCPRRFARLVPPHESTRPPQSDRDRLRALAIRAMRERGLDPGFLARGARRSRRTPRPPPTTAKDAVRDLRSLLWCSIDNDDSRDLDQLSVAEALAGGDVKVLVAIADVDAVVPEGSPVDRHAAVNTTSVYTPARVSDAAGAVLDRPHIAQPGRGSARRSSSSSSCAATASIDELRRLRRARAQSRQARLQRRRRLADRPRAAAAGRGRGRRAWTRS